MLELILVFGIVCFFFVYVYATTPNGTNDPVSNHYIKITAFIMGLICIISLLWFTFTSSTTTTQEISDINGTIIGYKTETVALTGGAQTLVIGFWKIIVGLLITLVLAFIVYHFVQGIKQFEENARVDKGHLPREG